MYQKAYEPINILSVFSLIPGPQTRESRDRFSPNLRWNLKPFEKPSLNNRRYQQSTTKKLHVTPTDNQCTSDSNCTADQACIQGRCANPCNAPHACGRNALCRTVSHRPRCSCPNCYSGRPDIECVRDPQCDIIVTPTPGQQPMSPAPGRDDDNPKDEELPQTPPPSRTQCRTDNDCTDNERCDAITTAANSPGTPMLGRCSDPCLRRKCDGNKKCETRRHRPMCVCKSGFAVNENGELQCAPDRQECVRDGDCSSDLACLGFRCADPCAPRSNNRNATVGSGIRVRPAAAAVCPADKSCQVRDHKAVCICMKDCSPSASICLRDSGCPAGQACRNYQCVDPCATASCAPHSPCTVENHRPVCRTCPAGFVPDARTGCQKGKAYRWQSVMRSKQLRVRTISQVKTFLHSLFHPSVYLLCLSVCRFIRFETCLCSRV